jgi:hypothetical protein
MGPVEARLRVLLPQAEGPDLEALVRGARGFGRYVACEVAAARPELEAARDSARARGGLGWVQRFCEANIALCDNFGGDLQLGNLAFNGGAFPMQTILPLSGSPVINAGDPGSCLAQDQRGANRVGVCDLGAVEYGAAAHRTHLPLVVRWISA